MPRVQSRHAPPSPAGSRRRLALPRHRATTANMCALYPAVIQAPLPQVGPLLGLDLTAGYGPLCWDPFEMYDEGIVTNPNVFVMGEPGFSKSSLMKCWVVWQHCLYGPSRWVTITDPKGEYRPLADRLGMSVVRLAPGGTVRINPLAVAPGLGGEDAERERAVQGALLAALAATHLARPLTQLERKVLRSIVAVTFDRRDMASPTLPDVVALLETPTGEMCDQTHRTPVELVRDIEELRFGLDELCTGALGGMFDGPSSVTVDWDSPGLVMDLSGVVHDQRAMALVMVAAIGWARQQRHRVAGRQRTNINDESYYMYRQIETVEFAQERRKLGRHYGEANIDICHRPTDLEAQADDGSKVAKMAAGLLSDSSMKIVFRQAAKELPLATEMLALTDTEQDCVGRLTRGKAIWKLADRSLLARHLHPAALHALTDTDTMMRRASALTDAELDTVEDTPDGGDEP